MSGGSPVEDLKEETNKNDGPYELTKGYEIDFEDDSKYYLNIIIYMKLNLIMKN